MPNSDPRARFTTAELAELSGVSERTVRYYLAEGLIPGPEGRGRGAHFGPGHLTRLRLVRALQNAGNSLDTIREYLDELGPGEAKAEAALRVWETRREEAQWAAEMRERLGAPSILSRYWISDGVELLVDRRAAPAHTRMAEILRAVRKAFAAED